MDVHARPGRPAVGWPRRRAPASGECSYLFAAAHPGQGGPAPHRGQVGGEEPLDEHGRDGLILGDARGGQPGDQAGLDDAEAAGDGDGAADDA